jgi:2-hydroxy-3-keto-5-methylthiopentenyl-1-phosphate phosphatase
MDLVRAPPDELNDLLDTIRVDEGLLLLLETGAAHNVPVHIISDGFDRCIQRILARASPPKLATLLRRVRVFSSHLEFAGQARWRTSFPFFPQTCEHNCATCKPALMQALNERNAPTIFVGDGLSDKYAAACADLVFAKRVWQIIAAKTLSHTFPTTRFTTLPLISQRCYDQTQICNAAQSATAPEKI